MKHSSILAIVMIGCGFLLISSFSLSWAQDGEFADDEYVGEDVCSDCHRGTSRDHEETYHAQALLEANEEALSRADFSQGDALRSVTFPGEDAPRPFVAEDISYVIGAGRYIQAFVYEVGENEHMVFPAEWNTVNNEWVPLELDENWPSDAYSFEGNCVACHVTGLELANNTWKDDGVQCEACHGPGGKHVNIADAASRNPDPEEITALLDAIHISPDAQICGQCHSQGNDFERQHPFATNYHPGDSLLETFELVPPDDETHYWATGQAKATNMGFNEWLNSAHANSLAALEGVEGADDTCLKCHSADYNWTQARIDHLAEAEIETETPLELPTLATAQNAVTCVACHDPHIAAPEEGMPMVDFLLRQQEPYNLCVSCHSDPDLDDGIHYPIQQMYEGLPVVEEVTAIPSSHFSAEEGPDCVSCHMPRVPVNSFSLASHSLQIVSPAIAADIEGLEDSCSGCHGEDASPQALSDMIAAIQSGTQTRLDTIDAQLTGDESAWVLKALDFVKNDSSLGVHNYTYTDALLKAIENELSSGGEDD